MSKVLSKELITEIRYYVKKYYSKIDVANKFGMSYETVLYYTRDIKLKSRKKDLDYLGIYGKSLDLLKELLKRGYAFSSKKYNTTHYVKLKKYFPNIRRVKMHGKMINYLDDKSKIASNALLNSINKKVMSYQELKQIERAFDVKLNEK